MALAATASPEGVHFLLILTGCYAWIKLRKSETVGGWVNLFGKMGRGASPGLRSMYLTARSDLAHEYPSPVEYTTGPFQSRTRGLHETHREQKATKISETRKWPAYLM